MAKLLARLDRSQRRHPALGFPVAVAYKFFDDQGSYLAAILTYYAFIAIFPLLLIASSVLGFLLHDNPTLQRELLDSGLSQFPIIGQQLGRPGQLQGSASAIAVGALAALYGATGMALASQNLMLVLWSVPRNSRPNPFVSRLRSLLLVLVSGVAFFCVAAMGTFGTNSRVLGDEVHVAVRLLIDIASVLFTAGVFVLLFRLTTAHHHTLREAAPGALTVGVLWQALQVAGSAYVNQVIAKANDMNKTFALVLGLVAVLYVASVMAVLAAEINVVRARRFYPRALLTPFTDNVDLTEGDRRAYVAYAKGQRYKGFEVIDVSFAGRHHREQPPPGRAQVDAKGPTAPPDSSSHP
ncbi:MAG: YihY/virulence factor BrkB family protein [Nocardioidaceae bacterium]